MGVVSLVREVMTAWEPEVIDQAIPTLEELGVAQATGRQSGSSDETGEPPVALSKAGMVVWHGEDPKLKDDGSLDRSGSLMKIGRVLYDAGANRPVVEAALEERDWTLGWNKYTSRPDARERYAEIVDELEKTGRNPKIRVTQGQGSAEEDNTAEDKEDRRNQADRLINYALKDAGELFTDQHGAPHALAAGEPLPLNSRCYSWLRRLMWDEEGKAVNGEYLKTAAGTLAAHAEFSGESRELHTRAAWLPEQDALYYELAPGRVVRVDRTGWNIEDSPPVLFRRYPNLKPLPDPVGYERNRPGESERSGVPEDQSVASGAFGVLQDLVNLKSERDRRLFAAYLCTTPLPHIPRPILNAAGPMGSGKTTLGRICKRAVDPTAPETVRYDPRDILQKAAHAHAVMFDNLSSLSDAAADTLCKLVTGEADSKRRLYTDDEDVIVELRRLIILNGISIPTDRGDVLDRSLVVELERIPDDARRTEEELWRLFDEEHPRLLGAIFDTLAMAIKLKPFIKLSRRPRLADWGEYAAAVYEALGWGAETFLADWEDVVKAQNQSTLDGSPVAQAVIKFMEEHAEWSGSSSELHKKLETVAEGLGVSVTRDKEWPKSARWLWRRVKEVLPLLAASGIEASRREEKSGSTVTLREVSTANATDATTDRNRLYKPDSGGISGDSNATANATGRSNATDAEGSNATGGNTDSSNATADATSFSHTYADSGDGGNNGIRNGNFSQEPYSKIGKGWIERQADTEHALDEGMDF